MKTLEVPNESRFADYSDNDLRVMLRGLEARGLDPYWRHLKQRIDKLWEDYKNLEIYDDKTMLVAARMKGFILGLELATDIGKQVEEELKDRDLKSNEE